MVNQDDRGPSQRRVLEPKAVAIIVNTLFRTYPVRPVREFLDLGPIIPFGQKEVSSGP